MLGLCTSAAGGLGSIPGQGTRIPQAPQCGKKKGCMQLCEVWETLVLCGYSTVLLSETWETQTYPSIYTHTNSHTPTPRST